MSTFRQVKCCCHYKEENECVTWTFFYNNHIRQKKAFQGVFNGLGDSGEQKAIGQRTSTTGKEN